MAEIIAYDEVLRQAASDGLRCVYPGGAAFAPAGAEAWSIAGWITSDDTSIRPALRDRVVQTRADELPALAVRALRQLEVQAVWLAPVHHWAAELQHGDGAWLPAVLQSIGVQADMLKAADAVAMETNDAALPTMLGEIFAHLWKSDFTLLLPGHRVVATVHHHRQLWWRCADAPTSDALLRMT